MKDENETRNPETSRSADPGEKTGPRPPKIIIAEDDEEMASLLVRAFKKAGYDVDACQNGWDLLRLLGVFPASDAYKSVSLVVSDIRLRGISGLDALKTCGYAGRFPPIILITAFGDQRTHDQARKYGAVDMLDKPFDIDELLNKVRDIVPPLP